MQAKGMINQKAHQVCVTGSSSKACTFLLDLCVVLIRLDEEEDDTKLVKYDEKSPASCVQRLPKNSISYSRNGRF